jgi:hypothetical protein
VVVLGKSSGLATLMGWSLAYDTLPSWGGKDANDIAENGNSLVQLTR